MNCIYELYLCYTLLMNVDHVRYTNKMVCVGSRFDKKKKLVRNGFDDDGENGPISEW